MFGRNVRLHRLVFPAQRQPTPLRHGKGGKRFSHGWIIGGKDDLCFCLVQSIIGLTKLPQQ